jgi:putative glutathione S-transferase
MGLLVDGQWVEKSIVNSDKDGSYDRLPRTFLDTISHDHSKFTPDSNRYHLYVSYACPWAHRTLIYRQLKELDEHISVSVVHPDMLKDGWTFLNDFPNATGDHLHNFSFLREVYQKADPQINTSVTVPILWDKKHETIVNNESSEIIRIFNSSFNELTGNQLDFYPFELREEIDKLNDLIYHNVNNGVYKSGFAVTQKAYDEAVTELFQTLDFLEEHLEGKDFLVGNQLTEADIRLIPTLLRFDIVYVTHFKCNIRRIRDYKNLSHYTKKLFEIPAVGQTTDFDHIKRHYYFSHEEINPYRILPKGPDLFI